MATATARSRSAAPRRKAATQPAPLRGIPGKARRRRLPELLAVLVVGVALLAIVLGQMVLAQGQLQLGHLNSAVTAETSRHSQTVLKVAALETPSRISSEASSLALVQPKKVLQLPMVPLDAPLAPIRIIGAAPTGGAR